jgi:hypothetical protein
MWRSGRITPASRAASAARRTLLTGTFYTRVAAYRE